MVFYFFSEAGLFKVNVSILRLLLYFLKNRGLFQRPRTTAINVRLFFSFSSCPKSSAYVRSGLLEWIPRTIHPANLFQSAQNIK